MKNNLTNIKKSEMSTDSGAIQSFLNESDTSKCEFKFSFQKTFHFPESSQNKKNFPIPPAFVVQQNPGWESPSKLSVFLQTQNTQRK